MFQYFITMGNGYFQTRPKQWRQIFAATRAAIRQLTWRTEKVGKPNKWFSDQISLEFTRTDGSSVATDSQERHWIRRPLREKQSSRRFKSWNKAELMKRLPVVSEFSLLFACSSIPQVYVSLDQLCFVVRSSRMLPDLEIPWTLILGHKYQNHPNRVIYSE